MNMLAKSAVWFFLSSIGVAQTQPVSATLAVSGHDGQATVIHKDGRSYVDVEALARITGGTLGFQGKQIVLTLPQLRNYNVMVREWHDEIVFLHKIAPGSADKSYGIHVARLAGLPAEVLDRAREVLGDLEAHHVEARQRPIGPRKKRRESLEHQPSLFADPEPDGRKPKP